MTDNQQEMAHQLERDAIHRLKQGDIQALEELVARYHIKALRVAYLVTHDHRLAEDVVQSAFIRMYQRIDQFDETRPFAPWFLRSVVNAAIQASQREKRNVSLDSEGTLNEATFEEQFSAIVSSGDLSPEEALEAKELQDKVWSALQALSPEQRGAVVLRYYLDLSEQEMSIALNRPVGTVKWRLHAARKQLRVLLGR